MILDYIGVKEINGSLIVIDNVENAFYEETVDIRLDDGSCVKVELCKWMANVLLSRFSKDLVRFL